MVVTLDDTQLYQQRAAEFSREIESFGGGQRSECPATDTSEENIDYVHHMFMDDRWTRKTDKRGLAASRQCSRTQVFGYNSCCT